MVIIKEKKQRVKPIQREDLLALASTSFLYVTALSFFLDQTGRLRPGLGSLEN
jgi:hypothetical protein